MKLVRWLAVGLAGVACLAPLPADGGAAAAPGVPGAAGLGDPYYPLDGNGGYDVTHYEIDLSYDPEPHLLSARTTVNATAKQRLSQFNLDYTGPALTLAEVNGQRAAFRRTDQHELVISPARPVPPGPFTVRLEYSGVILGSQWRFRTGGWASSGDGGVFQLGEPHGAGQWFPLNDTPRDKATFRLDARVPQQWEVMAGGIRTRDEVRDGWRTVRWEQRDPAPGYLFPFAVGKFGHLIQHRANGTPLVSAFSPDREQTRRIERRLPEVLDFLEDLYGPYPFESGGGIYVDRNIGVALETQTRPTYAAKPSLATMVHEQAHQWWGDSMSVQNWSDVCLNECFASYTADYLWPERKEGANPDELYHKWLARTEAKSWRRALANPGAGQEFTVVYTRGPAFLHALRRLLGDDVFFPAVKDFVRQHRFGNASMPEFRRFIQSRAGKDLAPFFAAWLDQETRPPDEFLFPGRLRR